MDGFRPSASRNTTGGRFFRIWCCFRCPVSSFLSCGIECHIGFWGRSRSDQFSVDFIWNIWVILRVILPWTPPKASCINSQIWWMSLSRGYHVSCWGSFSILRSKNWLTHKKFFNVNENLFLDFLQPELDFFVVFLHFVKILIFICLNNYTKTTHRTNLSFVNFILNWKFQRSFSVFF